MPRAKPESIMHLVQPIEVAFGEAVYRYHGAGDWEIKPRRGGGAFMEFRHLVPGEVVFAVKLQLEDRQWH